MSSSLSLSLLCLSLLSAAAAAVLLLLWLCCLPRRRRCVVIPLGHALQRQTLLRAMLAVDVGSCSAFFTPVSLGASWEILLQQRPALVKGQWQRVGRGDGPGNTCTTRTRTHHCFSSTLKVFGADIKALQITLGSSSTFPCPHCLISLQELRSLDGVTCEYPLRNSLLHGADHLDLQMDRNGDIAFAKEYHNCIHPPPFIYGLPQMHRNIVIGMSVLHISIGLGNKLLKLVRSFAPDATAFSQLLTEHRLSFYKYHGETLRGPQVHRLLTGKEPLHLKVLEAIRQVKARDTFLRQGKIIVSQSSAYSHLLELFQLFAACYQLYTADRFLSPEEMASLSTQCRSFGVKFKEHFPLESITLKMHQLAVDIPRFARTYGTVGLYSEQAIESMHAEENQLMRDYAGVGENIHKHKLVFQALYRKHCPAIPAFEPPRRLCSVCDLPFAQNKDTHTACQLIRRHK